MALFFIALSLLIFGYFIYGKFVENVWGINPDRKTPAVKYNDGVDFVPMPLWRIFLIQFKYSGPWSCFWCYIGCRLWSRLSFMDSFWQYFGRWCS